MNDTERRKHPRHPVTLQVRGRFFDTADQPYVFDGETMNVGREGVAILCYDSEERLDFFRSLLSENPRVELEVTIPPEDHVIGATGTVRWYAAGITDPSLHYLIAGVRFSEMLPQAKQLWDQFMDGTGHSTAVELSF